MKTIIKRILQIVIFISLICLLGGCGNDDPPIGSLRISIKVNGLGDTTYVVQRYGCVGSGWAYSTYSEPQINWSDYDSSSRYKTIKEAQVRIEQIKRADAKDNNREIGTIP